ncbi:MAG: DNA polymerase I, partial [Betaproteobacteria bacterium]|nr:DNA polymerase I [Betaproteobacteria bacterium]
MSPAPDLLLVDGSSYLYRAFFAMPDLRSPQGEPTGALYGMVNMLRKLAEQVPARYRACVFDAPGKTFRDDWYPDYKATRTPMPDALRSQIAPIHRVVELLGWKVIEVPGIEADDVIGTLAVRAQAEGMRCLISSGDKDLTQLVTDFITQMDTMNDKVFDRAGVLANFGVPPEQIVDYLTLMGDSVDNVPGVEKVGPKTAVKLLAEYGSVDALLARAGEVKGAVGENLRKAADWLPQARRLLTVKTDCELPVHSWSELVDPGEDDEQLLEFFKQHGFKSWTRELEARLRGAVSAGATLGEPMHLFAPEPLPDAAAAPAAPAHYETVLTRAQLDAWVHKLDAAALTALDTETTSLDEMQARVVGISL